MMCVHGIMFIAEVNSSRTNLSPFTKGYRGLASRMQLVSNLLEEILLRGNPSNHKSLPNPEESIHRHQSTF